MEQKPGPSAGLCRFNMGLRSIGQKLAPSKRVKIRLPEKKALSFYHSPQWVALVETIKVERGRRCEDPDHDRSLPRGGHSVRIIGDHIIELRDGGAPLDKNNVMLRCATCHGRKTSVERTKRRGEGEANL